MAIALPVLERRTSVQEEYGYETPLTKDEVHNSRISDNYAKLINPGTRIDDMLGREVKPVQAPVEERFEAPAAPRPAYKAPLFANGPVLVESARTSSELFLADSAINAKAVDKTGLIMPVVAQSSEEEEDEDLRPTQTTIQYKTAALAKDYEEGKIENAGAEKHFTFTKRQKITIAVIVSVVVALFTLIIINSAIISGINKDINSINASLNSVTETYATVDGQLNEVKENLELAVEQYAKENNMVKVAE